MALFKCPKCGETSPEETSPSIFKCKVCGSIFRDTKLDEILEKINNAPDDYIGNVRHRLNLELEKDVLDYDVIRSLVNKILVEQSEDVFAEFVLHYIQRNRNKKGYKEYLEKLCDATLENYLAKQIAEVLIHFYEPIYYELTRTFIVYHALDDSYLDELLQKKESMPDYLDLIDSHIHRNVFVLSSGADLEKIGGLVKSIEDNKLSCWYEIRNLDIESDPEEEKIKAMENSDLILICSSRYLWEEKSARRLINHVLDNYIDNIIPKVIVYQLDDFVSQNAKINAQINVSYSSGLDSLNVELQKLLDLNVNQDLFLSEKKMDDIKNMLERQNYNFAIRELENLLLETDDEPQVRKLLMRAYHESNSADTNEAQINFKRLKEMLEPSEIETLEDTYPSFINENETFQNGVDSLMDENYENALKFFNKGAKKNHPDSINRLGQMYFVGNGVAENPSTGIEYLKKAARLGCADAYRMLGVIYLFGNKVEKNLDLAFNYFLNGADLGNSFCQLKVAHCYQDGVGTFVSDTKAFEYFEKAAKQGEPEAYRYLGYCYKYGKGTRIDKAKALECFNAGASKGDTGSIRETCNF